MKTSFEIQIPFAGFYSAHDTDLDDAFNQMLSDRETGCESAPDSIVNAARDATNWGGVYRAYAKEYTKAFLREFDLTGEFSAMESPREYNFETDRIFVLVNRATLAKIIRGGRNGFADIARRKFTSRDGFPSFYDPDWKTWGRIGTWDHNQLSCLLEAYVETTSDRDFDYMAERDLMESASCNGAFENWFFEFSSPKLARVVKLWDYLQIRATRPIKTLAQWHAARRAENRPWHDTPLGAL